MAITGVNGGSANYGAYITPRAAQNAGGSKGDRDQALDDVKQEIADAISAIRDRCPQSRTKK